MRFGIITPIVSRNPRFGPHDWERTAGIEDVADIVQTAERLGYEFATFPEHVAVPLDAARTRGGTYWSPLPTMGYVAAGTSRIRLATYVVVLGYHHPLQIVKEYGTLDRLSGGRLVLGVGVGSLEAEFDLLGADFTGRGARADDALRAIRACFAQPRPTYQGPYFRVDDVLIEPCGIQPHLPIWVGGRTRRALRRALDLADGWAPFQVPMETATAWLREGGATSRPFEVILRPEPPLDPSANAGHAGEEVARYQAAGATALALRFEHRSKAHYLEQLGAMAEVSG
jgi:probable F420-dependent oxidoreductase